MKTMATNLSYEYPNMFREREGIVASKLVTA